MKKKMQTCRPYLEVNGKIFIYCFSVVTTFSNSQATFLVSISPKVFGIFTPNLPQKSENMTKFCTKITLGLIKIGGMMLWIMTGTFKLF